MRDKQNNENYLENETLTEGVRERENEKETGSREKDSLREKVR